MGETKMNARAQRLCLWRGPAASWRVVGVVGVLIALGACGTRVERDSAASAGAGSSVATPGAGAVPDTASPAAEAPAEAGVATGGVSSAASSAPSAKASGSGASASGSATPSSPASAATGAGTKGPAGSSPAIVAGRPANGDGAEGSGLGGRARGGKVFAVFSGRSGDDRALQRPDRSGVDSLSSGSAGRDRVLEPQGWSERAPGAADRVRRRR